MRLVYGCFGHEDDPANYQIFKTELDNGTVTRTQIATQFVTSDSWAATYGTQTDTQFITSSRAEYRRASAWCATYILVPTW